MNQTNQMNQMKQSNQINWNISFWNERKKQKVQYDVLYIIYDTFYAYMSR